MAAVIEKTCARCGTPFEVRVGRGSTRRMYCAAACKYPPARLDGSPRSRGGLAASQSKRAAAGAPESAGSPATCDRVYTDDEAEFLKRVADYRAKTGKTFPTCTELFRIVLGMGYRKGTA